MKKLDLTLLCIIINATIIISQNNQNYNKIFPSNNDTCTYILFENVSINFDTINAGDIINRTVKFKNSSLDTFEIKELKTSCGCVIPYFPRKKIYPGDMDSINVKFDSRGKYEGDYITRIEVKHNLSPKSYFLTLKGYIYNIEKGKLKQAGPLQDTLSSKQLNYKIEEHKKLMDGFKELVEFFDKNDDESILKFNDIFIIDTLGNDKFLLEVNPKTTEKLFLNQKF